jgi:hypothetical protein
MPQVSGFPHEGSGGLTIVHVSGLSFSLETEIEGVAPWRRALTGGAGTIRRAAANARDFSGATDGADERADGGGNLPR